MSEKIVTGDDFDLLTNVYRIEDRRNKSDKELDTKSFDKLNQITEDYFSALDNIYRNSDWAYIAVNSLAKLGKLALPRVYKYDTEAEDGESKTQVPNHVAQQIFEKPNRYQNSSSFLYSFMINYFISGNGLFWFAKESKGLWILPSRTVTPKLGAKGIEGYFASPISEDKTKVLMFDADDVVHLRMEDPDCLFWGLSPFIPARKALQFNNYATNFLNAFFKKGATFPVVFEREGGAASEEKLLAFVRQFERAYTGVEGSRRALALPAGVTAKPMHHKIADNETLQSMDKFRDVILNVLGVAKHAVSLAEAGSLGSEEYKTALRMMFVSSVKPVLDDLSNEITAIFKNKKILEPDEYFEFDYSGVESITDDTTSRARTAQEMLKSGLTLNEVRARVWEAEPIEGGDVSVVLPARPSFSLPNMAPSEPDEVEESEESEESDDKSLEARKGKFKIDILELAKPKQQKQNSIEATGYGAFAALSLDLFASQAEIAIELFVNMASQKDVSLSRSEYLKRLRQEFAKLQAKWNEDYTAAAFPIMNMGIELQLGAAFFLEDVDTVSVLVEANKDEINTLMRERGIESFKTITKTSAKDIFDVIARELKAGSTIPQISRAIAAKAGTWPDYRTERIARTEVLTAMTVGQQAVDQAIVEAFPEEQFYKVWLTAEDDDVRDTHKELHMTHVRMEEPFVLSDESTLDYPRDLNGLPENTIQCRCSYLIVTKEELAEL